MSRELRRILCPNHTERTPSFVIRDDGWGHCYGCGHREFLPQYKEDREDIPKEEHCEDILQSLLYIDSLPKKLIRGLDLPYDHLFYYIVWPNALYYKKRLKDVGERKSKYLCPKGHRKPLLIANSGDSTLLVVEGEINALSLALAFPEHTVVSPGGTQDIWSNAGGLKFKDYLAYYKSFRNLYILVDDDKAGLSSGMELTAHLLSEGNKTSLIPMSEDANHILEHHGKEKLRSEISKRMGLP